MESVSCNPGLDTCVSPIFREGSCPDHLLSSAMSVGISILPSHPCLLPSNNYKLVSFLMALPQPSIIFLADSINLHNVKAMWKRGRRAPTDEEALSLALEAAVPFHDAFHGSLQQLEEEMPERKGWVRLVRWTDIQGETMTLQQNVVKKHYESNGLLKSRIDEIALTFLQHRRPMSKNHTARLPHMVAYLLVELPTLLVGVEMDGRHYAGLLYPLAARALGSPIAMDMFDLKHDIHTLEEFAGLRKEITELTAAGRLGIPGVMLFTMEDAETKTTTSKKDETEDKGAEVVETTKQDNPGPKRLQRQISAGGA